MDGDTRKVRAHPVYKNPNRVSNACRVMFSGRGRGRSSECPIASASSDRIPWKKSECCSSRYLCTRYREPSTLSGAINESSVHHDLAMDIDLLTFRTTIEACM